MLMWTAENHGRYDRSGLCYPSDLTNAEWALIEPLISPAKRGGNKRTVDLREVVHGLRYVLSTACQWRAVPKDLAPCSTVYGYFARWTGTASWSASTTRSTSSARSRPGTSPARPPPLPAAGA